VQSSLALRPDGLLEVRRGTGTVLGTASGGTISVGSYFYLETKIKIDPSVGTVDVWVNGVNVLSLTGQNTRSSANSLWTQVGYGWNYAAVATSSANNVVDYDDIYVFDGSTSRCNTAVGDVRVTARVPTAEGNSSQWTPSTGTDNAVLVDESAPNGDTDYNSTSTTGNKDTHVTQDLPVSGVTVHGVQACMNARKIDAGAGTVAPVVRSGGSDADGTEVALGTTYAYALAVLPVNPVSAGSWTESDFNAAEFGYKKVQ
jgi:hypothetical protein